MLLPRSVCLICSSFISLLCSLQSLPTGPRSILFREFLPVMKPLLEELRDIARQRKKSVAQVERDKSESYAMNVDLSLDPTLNRFCSTAVVIECRIPITHSSHYLSYLSPALSVCVVSCCYFPTLLLGWVGILHKVALNWNLQKGFLVLVGIRSVEQVWTTLTVIKYCAIA